MFQKKNFTLIIQIIFVLFVLFYYLYYKNSYFSHWSYALDQDITIIYNSLLLTSSIDQEYLDHPGYTTMFILNIVYQIAYLFKIISISSFNDLVLSLNKDKIIQDIYNISLIVHLIYSLIFLHLLFKILNSFINDKTSCFFLICIILISPAFIHLFDIIRSEILSLIFCFLYFIYLEKFVIKGSKYLIISGIFFSLALFAKVQVIFLIYSFLILFLIRNKTKIKQINFLSYKFYKDTYYEINLKIFLINLLFAILVIIFCLNFFYKVIDGLFFIFIFLSHFFILILFLKEKQFITTPIILFSFGAIISVIFMKYLGLSFVSNSFHPELIKVVANPISQSANISSSYKFTKVDNIDFLFLLIDFIKKIPETSHGKYAQFNIVFNKLSVLTYLISIFYIFFNFIKKKKTNLLTIIIINLIITVVNLIFSIRPYQQYLIYSFPLNLILLSIIVKNQSISKYIIFFTLMFYIYLDFENIKSSINEIRKDNGNMDSICTEDYLNNKSTYMRMHRKIDKKFLIELCNDFNN